MNKKLVFCLVGFIAFLVVPVSAGAKKDVSSEKVVLEFWSITGKDKYFGERIRQFEKLNPNITVHDEFQPHADNEKKLPTAIASGTAPDIWNQSYRSVADYRNQIQPLTEDIAKFIGYINLKAAYDAWVPAAIEQYMVDGKIYAFIWEANYFGWVINKKHFIEAGLDPAKDYPKTWEDVIRVGKILTQMTNGRISRQAVGFPYARPPVWYMMEFQPILLEMGGDFFNKEGTECTINSPEAIEAMKFIKRRFDESITDKGLSSTQDYGIAIQNQEVSMGINSFIGWIDRYEKANPEITGNLMQILNPSVPGRQPAHGASTWAYSVNVKSGDSEKIWSWKLIDYLTNDPSSALIGGDTLIPRLNWEKTEGGKQLRDSELVAEAVRTSFPSGTLVHWTEIQLPVQKAMQRILYEGADIKTELDQTKAEVDRAIRNK
jgi:multiple sugar transport system substrate-binding protein